MKKDPRLGQLQSHNNARSLAGTARVVRVYVRSMVLVLDRTFAQSSWFRRLLFRFFPLFNFEFRGTKIFFLSLKGFVCSS